MTISLFVWKVHFYSLQDESIEAWYKELYAVRGVDEMVAAWLHLAVLWSKRGDLEAMMRKISSKEKPKILRLNFWLLFIEECTFWLYPLLCGLEEKGAWPIGITLSFVDLLADLLVLQFFTITVILSAEIRRIVISRDTAVAASAKFLRIVEDLRWVNLLFRNQNLLVGWRLSSNLLFYANYLRKEIIIFYESDFVYVNIYSVFEPIFFTMIDRVLFSCKYLFLLFLYAWPAEFTRRNVSHSTSRPTLFLFS